VVLLLCHYYGLGCLYVVRAFTNGSNHDRWITSLRRADHRLMRAKRSRRGAAGVLVVLAAGSSSASARKRNRQESSAFANLVENLVETIIASDAKRDTKGQDGASTGWTSWVDEAAAARLSRAVSALRLATVPPHQHTNDWPQWIMECPAPIIVEYAPLLANEVRRYVATRPKERDDDDGHDGTALGSTSTTTTRASYSSSKPQVDRLHNNMIVNICSRLGMRLLYLPSGGTFATTWRAPPGAMIYGLALHGGIKRFRRLGGGGGTTTDTSSGSSSSRRAAVPRKAGERTIIVPNRGGGSDSRQPAVIGGDTTTADAIDLSWLQYGGPERNYEALDIGPCLFMEVLLYPDGLAVPPLLDDDDDQKDAAISTAAKDLVITSAQWHPNDFLSLANNDDDATVQDQAITSTTNDPTPPTDISRFKDQVLLSVGGLPSQIDQIIRRVVDGRATGNQDGNGDMSFLYSLGLAPLRGMLLYGPPGWYEKSCSTDEANAVVLLFV
jgi:hypothetical protein